MNSNRNHKILCWNVRGINSQEKWDAIRAKVIDSSCNILCLQETKRDNFNVAYLKKFCPRQLDSFAFYPSAGASGGLITVWNSGMYQCTVVQANSFGLTIKVSCNYDQSTFHITNVYRPAHASGKMPFVTWLMNLDTTDFDDWILVGDFNLYRSSDDRNKPGGDYSEMQLFNGLISDLDLIDIPFCGRRYTWSNMQTDPLLIKLDWVLTSSAWGLSYPATTVQPLSRNVSDHIPFCTNIGSKIPKESGFRFENFWVDQPDFLETVELHWNSSPFFANAAKTLSAKFKQVRTCLRQWSKKLSNLNKLIHNSNWVLLLLDGIEDQRPLDALEVSFRTLVKGHLATLLESKRKYWKQRNTIRWVILGDENSSFF